MLTRKPLWMVVSAVSAAAAGIVTRKLVDVAWRAGTGEEIPPEQDDRSTSLGQALAWAAGVGAAAGVARVLSRRGAAAAWEKATGDPPPGEATKL
jgi:hypothetical protein